MQPPRAAPRALQFLEPGPVTGGSNQSNSLLTHGYPAETETRLLSRVDEAAPVNTLTPPSAEEVEGPTVENQGWGSSDQ